MRFRARVGRPGPGLVKRIGRHRRWVPQAVQEAKERKDREQEEIDGDDEADDDFLVVRAGFSFQSGAG